MTDERVQRLVEWKPFESSRGGRPPFGDVGISSPEHGRLIITFPFDETGLRIEFKDVRALMASWDGDPNPFLTFEETASRPSDLIKIEGSRWLASCIYSDIESSHEDSQTPWEHFCIVSDERTLHIAARDDIEVVCSRRS